MKNENLKLTGNELYGLRKRAVKMRKKGHTHEAVASAFCIGKSTSKKWWALYQQGGFKALRPDKRGRKTGQKRRLSPEREAEIRRLIADKSPDQLKMPFALWTRRAVMELIRTRYGIKMPIRTVGEYLKRWGYTPQKPLKKAYEQNPKAVQRWLDEEYPTIHAQAKAEGAEIHWADETGLRSDSQHGRGYAPKGKTPVQRLNAKRVSTNMISTVTNQGKVRFMVFDGGMNARLLIKFFKRLVKDAKRKVLVILDNLRVHHAKIVKEWTAKHAEAIKLFFLPSYSPELNPDEYLNCDLKAGVHSREPARTQKHLKKKIISHMRMLQNSSKRVKKYFQHNKIKYAA